MATSLAKLVSFKLPVRCPSSLHTANIGPG